jgi:DNA-binding GntR family transcriptional regulator
MEKKANLKDKVYSTLRGKILSFEMKPGEKILESGVAQDLGVSRTPIREALNKLEQEGLIRVLPNKGYFVSDVTTKEIEELYEIRETLEVLAIRGAVRNAGPDDWARLEQLLLSRDGKEENGTKETETELFMESHRFHEELVRISGNQTLEQILNTVSVKINRLGWMNVFFVDRSISSHGEHMEILQLLKEGKADEAVAANQRHIEHSKESILALLHRKRDLFYIS